MPCVDNLRLHRDRSGECLPITPIANSRKRVHGSATNLHSQKKRRLSFASVDLGRALDYEMGNSRIQSISTVSRNEFEKDLSGETLLG
jgi:hypothetical protein